MTVYSIPPCEECCEPVTVGCCASGDVAQTLNCDLTSTCAGYNGSFTLSWNAGLSQWEGVYSSTVCGSACEVPFAFRCVSQDGGGFIWRLLTNGAATGCDAGACAPAGLRGTSAGSNCSPLDINLNAGSLAVGALCSCCASAAITARVYE